MPRSVQKALYLEVGLYLVPFYRRGHPWAARSQRLDGRTAYRNSGDHIRPLDCGANIDRSTVLCPSRCVGNARNTGRAEVGWDSDRLSCRNTGHGVGLQDSDRSTCARALRGGCNDRRNHGDGNNPYHRSGGVLGHQCSYLDCCSKALARLDFLEKSVHGIRMGGREGEKCKQIGTGKLACRKRNSTTVSPLEQRADEKE